jgi:tetratricopeptide (TPR) repeat protein
MKTLLYTIFLTFSISSFCQTEDEKIWWEMQRNGKHLEVASYLLYKVQSDSTRNKHANYLHIARSYGYLNEYDKAVFYWKKSFEDLKPEDDEQFWWYYSGTLAFFERDKETLFKYMNLLKKTHYDVYKNNALLLESLYDNFDKEYEAACKIKK